MPTNPLSYEVTVHLDHAEDATRFARWMREEHIPEVLATSLIQGADFAQLDPVTFRTRYRAPSQVDLDAYLTAHSPALRDKFAAQFGDGATSSREVWSIQQEWP
jgi:hypothetical protein